MDEITLLGKCGELANKIAEERMQTFEDHFSKIVEEMMQHHSKQESNEASYAKYVECDSNVSVDDLFVELNGLTGLETVKQEVKTLIIWYSLEILGQVKLLLQDYWLEFIKVSAYCQVGN